MMRSTAGHVAVVVGLVFAASMADVLAATLISEGVTYSPTSHLYTYRYAIDNTTGVEPVCEAGIVITPGALVSDFPPFQHTSPPGWSFATAIGGPNAVFGTVQQWDKEPPTQTGGVQPGERLTGFSFSTPYPPRAGHQANYFLFHRPSQSFETGAVLAPELAVAQLHGIPALDQFGLGSVAVALALAGFAALKKWQ